MLKVKFLFLIMVNAMLGQLIAALLSWKIGILIVTQ